MLKNRTSSCIAVACAAVISILAVTYYYYDPTEVDWMPRCLWKVVTATDCPGCGSQRMAHALMHGDICGAWHANAFALCMLPIIVFMIWLELMRGSLPKLYSKVHSPWVIRLIFIMILAWWIIRNLF